MDYKEVHRSSNTVSVDAKEVAEALKNTESTGFPYM